MKLLLSLHTLLVALGLAILTGSVSPVAARPKVPWAQHRAKGQARRAFAAAQQKRNESEESCLEREALLTTAPKVNVWGSLTGEEASSVVHWLFAQQELNLTVMEDAGAWDNVL